VSVNFRDLSLGDSTTIRDLWTRKELGKFKEKYTALVPQHGAVLIKVR
jgi:alpha-galactosidase